MYQVHYAYLYNQTPPESPNSSYPSSGGNTKAEVASPNADSNATPALNVHKYHDESSRYPGTKKKSSLSKR